PGNRFEGAVVIQGAAVTTVNLANSSTLASLPTLPAGVTDLTLVFGNAPIALPSYTLTNLSVNAKGISQQAGASLVISNQATFQSALQALNLGNTGNNFNQIGVGSSGTIPVMVRDSDGLTFMSSNLGTGKLTVIAGGLIDQVNSIVQS